MSGRQRRKRKRKMRTRTSSLEMQGERQWRRAPCAHHTSKLQRCIVHLLAGLFCFCDLRHCVDEI